MGDKQNKKTSTMWLVSFFSQKAKSSKILLRESTGIIYSLSLHPLMYFKRDEKEVKAVGGGVGWQQGSQVGASVNIILLLS